jgi:TctA family transporter
MGFGVVLGGLVESNYRSSLVLSDGDLMTFLDYREDPICVGFLVLANHNQELYVFGAYTSWNLATMKFAATRGI